MLKTFCAALLAVACEASVAAPASPTAEDRAHEDDMRRRLAERKAYDADRQAIVDQQIAMAKVVNDAAARNEIADGNAARRRFERMAEQRKLAEECAAEKAERNNPPADDPQEDARLKHISWVRDNCERVQPPAEVTCNPVCVARDPCPVWTCREHADWAEETTTRDCDGFHGRAIAIHVSACTQLSAMGR